MAKIIPFTALRPTRSKVNLIASRPFYTYKKNLLDAKLEGNPYTFLHVINPEFKKDDKTKPNSLERFKKVKSKFIEFKKLGYFIKDKKPSFYIYRQSTSFGVFTGIIGTAAVNDFINGIIKPHESTLTKRENTFKQYLDICKFNAEPILLSYKDNEEINHLIDEYVNKRAEYEFTTTDKKNHELWVINDPDELKRISENFLKIDNIYIADGHHRIASSVLYGTSKNKDDKLAQHFLSFFIAESKLKIFEYNRFINHIGSLSHKEFISKIKLNFKLTISSKLICKPTKKHEISMYFNKKWYLLFPKEKCINDVHPKFSLDTYILSQFILKPILDIQNVKTDDRVEFFNGARDYNELKAMVEEYDKSVAFCLYPHNFNELKLIADTNNSMPPKSTWIEPKLRSGLTIYEL